MAVLLTCVGTCLASAAFALEPPDYALKPRSLAQGVYVIEGEVADFSRANGCNIINTGWIETPAGTWVVNTGPSLLYGQQQKRLLAQRPQAGGVRVLNLNLHPDYFFGNQAWSDVPTLALQGSIEGMQREGGAYADNLYALCGDWMKDTASSPAHASIEPGLHAAGRLELLRLSGHTADDLVVIDHKTGVVFAGGLVFAERIPTTPHADLAQWLQSLDVLEKRLSALPHVTLVPSHGPVHADLRGIAQTRDYLRWLLDTLERSAAAGMDMAEVLAIPLPTRFARWGAARTEYARNVTHLYPQAERRHLRSPPPR
jgi:quinoprotein relay system zinc metallohydrolase 1